MSNKRLLQCATALLLVSAGGCTWFDDLSASSYAIDPDAGDGSTDEGPGFGFSGQSGGDGDGAVAGSGAGASGAGGAGGTGGHASGGQGGASGMLSAGEGGEAGDGDAPDASEGGDGDGDGDDDCDGGCIPTESTLRYHPAPRRFALTDESAQPGMQTRAWLVSGGDGENRLLSLRLLETHAAWIDTQLTGITTGPAAVSFTEGESQRQQVFFGRAGRLEILERAGQPLQGRERYRVREVPGLEGYAIRDGNLAAVLFGGEQDRRIAVLAPNTLNGYCVYEQILATGAWTVQCTDEAVVHAETDVAGAVVGDQVHFYFRSLANGLIRVARSATGTYASADVPTPDGRPIAQSIIGMASELPDRVELLVIAGDGEVWNARPLASERSAPVWDELSGFVNATRASLGPAALAAIVTHNVGQIVPEGPTVPFMLTELRMIGADGEQYQTVTNSMDAARSWMPGWFQVPPNGHDQYVRALGAMTFTPAFGYECANGLAVVGGERATTVQESQTLFNQIFWRDRLRFQNVASVASSEAVNELSAAAGGDDAIIAAALTSATPPLRVRLFRSDDGATTFGATALPNAQGDAGELSTLQPVVRYGGGRFHLATLERELAADCSAADGGSDRVVYRRGVHADALAALEPGDADYFEVQPATDAPLSNPALALTNGPFGATAHVVFGAGDPRELYYWQLGPYLDSVPTLTPLAHALPNGPLVIAAGNDEALYVGAADDAHFELCQVQASGAIAADACTSLDAFARPDSRELFFGPELAERYGNCGEAAAPYHACMRDDRPYAVAADTSSLFGTANHRLLVAYTAVDPDTAGAATSIYVTISRGGASLGSLAPVDPATEWSGPLRINTRADGRHYFDPEITIDARRTVRVTYSAIDPEPSADQLVRTYVAVGQLSGNVVTIERSTEVAAWHPSSLPMDCTTGRAALGSYHQPETVGSRTLHVLHREGGYDSRWLSEFVQW